MIISYECVFEKTKKKENRKKYILHLLAIQFLFSSFNSEIKISNNLFRTSVDIRFRFSLCLSDSLSLKLNLRIANVRWLIVMEAVVSLDNSYNETRCYEEETSLKRSARC